jgi:hypothetical protein
LKNSSISPRKNISGTYLIYRLFARGRATSKHGGGGRYAIFRVQRGAIKKNQRGANKKSKLQCESLVTECMTKKRKRMKERKKERREKVKNMSMCKNKVNSPVL